MSDLTASTYLAVMALAAVSSVAAAWQARKGRARAAKAPVPESLYQLRVRRRDGSLVSYHIVFGDGHQLTPWEMAEFENLFQTWHPEDGSCDPDEFVGKVLSTFRDGTGVQGHIYEIPVVHTFSPKERRI